MSTIAVNAITDANAGNTTTINGVTPNSANVVGKNLIINGAMQIAQRGTSTTGVTASGYFATDRFKNNMGNLGTWTISQDSDAPDGFSNSHKYQCTVANASPTGTVYAAIQHKIEGFNLQHLNYGTSSAKSVTLSFWVKSNKTGNIQLNFIATKMISKTVTINSANTWEKKIITIEGDTSTSISNNNNTGLIIEWWLDSGDTFTSGSFNTTWGSADNADKNINGTLALADSTSNYINITGVQLEVGESATEFEHRPYGMELQLCQRYYYKNIFAPIAGYSPTTSRADGTVVFPVVMRTTPTALEQSGTASDYGVYYRGQGTACNSVPTYATSTAYGGYVRFNCPAVFVVGEGTLMAPYAVGAYLAWSAEL